MKISHLVSRTIALAGLAVVGAGAAHAQDITPKFVSAVGALGNVTYTYGLYLGADTSTKAGDLVTFYDFNGLLTAGPNAPSFTTSGLGVDYSISTPLLGIDPPNTAKLAGDDPTLPNVTLTETGAGFANSGSGAQFLGTLVLHSTNLINGAGDFTPFAANTTKVSTGSAAGNQSFVSGPNLGPAATPEPGTWALLVGMGISGGVFARRRNRRK